MAKKREEEITTFCRGCRQMFSYRASLPTQTHCRECYYADKGDYTGAMLEAAWRSGYEQGRSEVLDPVYQQAEKVAKLIEALPLRDAIALCHPDRHPPERSELANQTTAVLLEIQRAVRDVEDARAA